MTAGPPPSVARVGLAGITLLVRFNLKTNYIQVFLDGEGSTDSMRRGV